jgi:2',3'-cyclic-nucleotide 2'-phosphodiesterase (5'-nucleotidase family)
VVVVATTDVHGHATGWDYLLDRPFPGGLARAASAVDSLRALYPGRVILVDAGDLIQGDPFATYFARVNPRDPHPVIDAMNLMAYDAATPGNHEFNFGVEFFRRAVAGAAFHYVSGNVYALPAGTLELPSSAVITRGGIRVGITGFTTPGVMVWDESLVRGRVQVGRVSASAPRVLAGLAGTVDLSIVLMHSGLGGASSYDTTGVGAEDVAGTLVNDEHPPHLVVVGHTHRQFGPRDINGVHYMQPPPHARGIAVAHVRLVRRAQRWRVISIEGEIVDLADREEDPRVLRRLERDHQAVIQWLSEPLAFAEAPMPALTARVEPTPIINFINAVQRRRTGAELSATAAFNIRGGIPRGDVLLSHVAGLYPYENTLRAIRISGAQLAAYLEHSARYFTVDRRGNVGTDPDIPGYNFDIVSGAEYTIDLRLPMGNRIRGLRVRGQSVQPTDSFTLAINSYRQAGGGGFDMLLGAPVVYDQGEGIRELLIDAVRAEGTLDPARYKAREWRIAPAEMAQKAMVLFSPAAATRPPPPRDTAVLRVLAINDFAGALFPVPDPGDGGRRIGGAAHLKTLMDSVAAECDCPSVRLDAGDHLRGAPSSSLVRGRSTIEVFNRVGMAASVPGHHDFGWSIDTLRQRMAEARYRWVAANIVDSVTGRPPPWVVPYRLMDLGTVRVGILGYVSPDTKHLVRADDLAGVLVRGPDVLRQHLAEVKRLGADVTVLLLRTDVFCGSGACGLEAVQLAETLGPGSVDLILTGGSATARDTVVAGIPIVEADDRGRGIAVVDVIKTVVGGREIRTRFTSVPTDRVPPDSAVARVLEEYRWRTDSIAAFSVATIKSPLMRRGAQHALGNLIADAFQNVLRTDLALMDNAGIHSDLQAGVVAWRHLFEMLPRQSTLVSLRLSGADILQVLESTLADGTATAHISGATVKFDPTRPSGRRVREIRLANGRKLKDKERYSIAVPEYLVGDPAWGIPRAPPAGPSGLIDLDAVVLYLHRLSPPIVSSSDPRFLSTKR